MLKNLLVSICFFGLILAVVGLDCNNDPPFQKDVCKFNLPLDGLHQSTQEEFCGIVNADPFNFPPPTRTGVTDQDRCNTLIRQDGKNCIKFYAKYQCSQQCSACLQQPCHSFCADVSDTCPGAFDGGCFDAITCDSDNTSCTDWDVDTSKLPDPISTGSSATIKVTTTRATSTTTTHTTSDSSMLSIFSVVTIAAVTMAFMISFY